MKRTLLISLVCMVICSCSNNPNKASDDVTLKSDVEQISADTTGQNKIAQFTKLLTKTGELHELKIYPMGSFKRIKLDVLKIKKLSSNENVEPFVKLEITYGDDYYWYTRSTLMLQVEIPDYIKSISVIKDNYLNTTPDVETIIGFYGFGDSKISATYKSGKWKCEFYVVASNEKTSVTFTKEECDELISLLNKINDKITELNQ